jgi:hypothetical protein
LLSSKRQSAREESQDMLSVATINPAIAISAHRRCCGVVLAFTRPCNCTKACFVFSSASGIVPKAELVEG